MWANKHTGYEPLTCGAIIIYPIEITLDPLIMLRLYELFPLNF